MTPRRAAMLNVLENVVVDLHVSSFRMAAKYVQEGAPTRPNRPPATKKTENADDNTELSCSLS